MNAPVLELCVESPETAVAAERGGADRIELCTDLSSGGVTPSVELMEAVRRRLHIPVHVLIRPRAGDFCYADHEIVTMRQNIIEAQQLGMDGVVLGVLDAHGRVDVRRTARLVRLADPLPVTFHRAFDRCSRLTASLESVIDTGATRLLTSGGGVRVTDGLAVLARLAKMAGNRIVIMPGGGIRVSNLRRVLRETGAREVHTSGGVSRSCRAFRDGVADSRQALFEAKVRAMRALLDRI